MQNRQIVKSSNILYSGGFTAVSNVLLDNYLNLGMNEDLLMFVIFIYRHAEGFRMTDEKLCSGLSSRTLQRRRKALKDLGLIDYQMYIKNDEETGEVYSYIIYDLSPLENKLMEMVKPLEEEVKKIEKKLEKTAAEVEDPKNPIIKYCRDFEKEYGEKYIITKAEQIKIASLKPHQKEAIGYIFDWYDYHKNNVGGLPENCIPRLSFFFKVPFRFKSLMDFYNERTTKIDDSIVEDEKDDEEEGDLVSLKDSLAAQIARDEGISLKQLYKELDLEV